MRLHGHALCARAEPGRLGYTSGLLTSITDALNHQTQLLTDGAGT